MVKFNGKLSKSNMYILSDDCNSYFKVDDYFTNVPPTNIIVENDTGKIHLTFEDMTDMLKVLELAIKEFKPDNAYL